MKFIEPNTPIIPFHNHPKALLKFVAERGIQVATITDHCSIDVQELDTDFDALISYWDYCELIARCQESLNEPALGLHFGQRLTFNGHGMVGLGALACNTVQEALELALAFKKMVSPVTHVQLNYEAPLASISCSPTFDNNKLYPFFVETLFATLISSLKQFTHQTHARYRFEFAYPEPHYASEYEHFFDGEIIFDAPHTRILAPREILATRLPTANPLIVHTTKRFVAASQSSHLQNGYGIIESIKQAIKKATTPAPSLPEIARQLHTSSSTLKRKLKEAQSSYTTILSQTQLERACQMLETNQKRVDDISVSLGYSEASAFRRAFKCWSGLTPSEYRQRFAYLQNSLAAGEQILQQESA